MKNLLPIVILAGLGYLIFNSAKNFLTGISYQILGASIDKQNTSISNIAVKINLGIQNDSQTSTELTRLYLQYYDSKGKLIGRTDTAAPINISPLSLTKIVIPVNIPTGTFLSSLGYSITDLILNKVNPKIKISGKIFFKAGSINVDEVLTLSVL